MSLQFTSRTNRRRRRFGATMVECAVTLPVMLLILFAMLDLGLAAMQYNTLAEASRRIAREAILHGSLAPSIVGSWGPTAFSGTAASGSTIVSSIHRILPTMTESLVNVQVTWPDTTNAPRDRVQVQVSFQHQPLIPVLCVWGTLNLKSVSTMHIVN